MTEPILTGSFRVLVLYDVCDEIRLDELRTLLSVPPARREPSFRQPAPEYVRFERPPVFDPLGPLTLATGERLACRMVYYDYGVVGVEMERPFESTWDALIRFCGEWIAAPELERRAAEIVRDRLAGLESALVNAYSSRLSEDYYVIQVHPLARPDGTCYGAAELLAEFGPQISQIVRGEAVPLAAGEQREVLESRMSYYPGDLLVVGWTAALVYDTPENAAPIIQLLEYANTQLLTFRHYDQQLTEVLARVYGFLGKRTSIPRRWRLAGEAERLSTIRLDVRELTERVDNSIKFLSDMFAARVYRLAAARIGVSDYRELVDDKLRTAGELYQVMVDRFEHSRVFVLELMVVIILVIDLIYLFRGRGL